MWREIVYNCSLGFVYATLLMMFDFAMNKGQVFSWYYKLISRWNKKKTHWFKMAMFKILGGCIICLGLWASYPAYKLIKADNYLIFLTTSQFILITRYGS